MKEFLAARDRTPLQSETQVLGQLETTFALCKKERERAQRKSKSKANHFQSSHRVRSRDRCRGCALDTHIVVSVFSFTE